MHIASLIHLLSIATGWWAFLVCLMLFFKTRKTITLYLSFFCGAMTLMILGIGIGHYGRVVGDDFLQASTIIGALGGNLFIIIMPLLVYRVFGLPFTSLVRTVSMGFSIFILCMSIVYLFVVQLDTLLIMLQISIFMVLGYCVLLAGLKMNSVGVVETRRFLKTVSFTTLLFFPLLMADSLVGQLVFLPYDLSLPIFFLIITIQIAIFALTHLDQPAYYTDDKLTDHCVSSLGLTSREKEIVESLLKGNTNKEISEELFISTKTVENHLSNIYQKTGVKNRTQLVNMIHSHSSA